MALRTAGGLSVGLSFLKAFRENPGSHRIDAFVPPQCGYEELASPQLTTHPVPESFSKPWLRPYLDRFWLRKRIEATEPDVVFSIGNFALPTKQRQVLQFMWPYVTYPESEVWKRMPRLEVATRKVKIKMFERRLKYADVVAPQTETSAERLKRYYPQIRDVVVVPTAAAIVGTEGGAQPLDGRYDLAGSGKKLLCLTRYYPHKNLEILIPLAQLIKERGSDLSVVTTIAKDQHPGAKQFLEKLEEEGLEDVIQNIGPVPIEVVPALYEATDGLLLPTLLESFSGTYVDAMAFRKPVFTSDKDFARDVCGEAAFYFDPHSAESIYRSLHGVFSDEESIMEKTEKGYARVQQFPDWYAVAQQYLDLLEEVATR